MVVLVLCFGQDLSSQKTIFVNAQAFGFNNGTSWDDAYTDLHEALRSADSGDNIWIAEGLYLTSTAGNRFATYDLDKSINIYGGFRGVETSLDQRPQNSLSRLSGEIGLPGVREDNAYHIMRIDDPDITVSIDGVVIEGAYGDFLGEDDFLLDEVGAVLIDNPAMSQMNVRFNNVIFRDNYAADNGGAIFIQDKSNSTTELTIEGCLFTEDKAEADGSAIYGSFLSESARVFVRSTKVEEISSDQQSFTVFQIIFRGSDNTLSVEDCLFINNQSVNPDPILAFGLFGQTSFSLKGTVFRGNTYGQVMFVNASGGERPTNVIIKDVQIINNNTFSSPLQVLNTAFGENRSIVSIDKLRIENNINGDTWILIDLHEINLESFDNNVFIGNKGGPLFLNPIYDDLVINNLVAANNSFLDVDFTNQFVFKNFDNYDITFNNSTFAYNDGIKGTVVRTFFNEDNNRISNLTFNNCIFFGNEDFDPGQPPELLVYSKNTSVHYNHCLLEADDCSLTVSNKGLGRVTCDASNVLGADPFFRSDRDFNLSFCSPAIDGGSNVLADHLNLDVQDQARVNNGTVDIGAYESESVTRDFGFSCSQGLIYSDWLPDLGEGVTVNYLENSEIFALNEQARFEIIGEGGCIDTVIVDVLPLTGIELGLEEESYDIRYGDTLTIPYISYLAEELKWTAFLDSNKIDMTADDRSLSLIAEGGGTYDIIAVNEFGCFYKTAFDVNITDFSSLLFIPNSISPNNDNINDDLTIQSLNGKELFIQDFTLFNRWGSIVSSMKNVEVSGSYNLVEGRELITMGIRPGVYVYAATVQVGALQFSIAGDVTIFN